jgi:hypothetical protein
MGIKDGVMNGKLLDQLNHLISFIVFALETLSNIKSTLNSFAQFNPICVIKDLTMN